MMLPIGLFRPTSATTSSVCPQFKLGERISVPTWANSDKESAGYINKRPESCEYYAKRLPQARSYLAKDGNSHTLSHKSYFTGSEIPQIGYTKSLNVSNPVEVDDPTEKESQDPYPVPHRFQQAGEEFEEQYMLLMDECEKRCTFINAWNSSSSSTEQCLYAHGIARAFDPNNLDDSPQELKNYKYISDTWKYGYDVYFHCTFGNATRGQGVPSFGYPSMYDMYSVERIDAVELDIIPCIDGDTYGSHTTKVLGANFGESSDIASTMWFDEEDNNSSLLMEQNSQKRDQFCGQYDHQMCMSSPLIPSEVEKVMSDYVPYLLIPDEAEGNPITSKLELISSGNFKTISDMDAECMTDDNCVGYNFMPLNIDNWNYEHPDNDYAYYSEYYTLRNVGGDLEFEIQDIVKYYRGNLNWHKRPRDDENHMFATSKSDSMNFAPNNVAPYQWGMKLKMTACHHYEENSILEEGCSGSGNNLKIKSSLEDVPKHYRVATAQEAADNMAQIRRLVENSSSYVTADWSYLGFSDGYMIVSLESGIGYEAVYDPSVCVDYGLCNLVLYICEFVNSHTIPIVVDEPSVNNFWLKKESDADVVTEKDRLATAEEVYANKDTFLNLTSAVVHECDGGIPNDVDIEWFHIQDSSMNMKDSYIPTSTALMNLVGEVNSYFNSRSAADHIKFSLIEAHDKSYVCNLFGYECGCSDLTMDSRSLDEIVEEAAPFTEDSFLDIPARPSLFDPLYHLSQSYYNDIQAGQKKIRFATIVTNACSRVSGRTAESPNLAKKYWEYINTKVYSYWLSVDSGIDKNTGLSTALKCDDRDYPTTEELALNLGHSQMAVTVVFTGDETENCNDVADFKKGEFWEDVSNEAKKQSVPWTYQVASPTDSDDIENRLRQGLENNFREVCTGTDVALFNGALRKVRYEYDGTEIEDYEIVLHDRNANDLLNYVSGEFWAMTRVN